MMIVYGLNKRTSARLSQKFRRVRFVSNEETVQYNTHADKVVVLTIALGHSDIERAAAVFGKQKIMLVSTIKRVKELVEENA